VRINNTKKPLHAVAKVELSKDGNRAFTTKMTEAPPTPHCTPFQPQAVMALESDGSCAPLTPKVNLENMGNGMPYFVPACELSWIGIRMMTFPRMTFKTANHGESPYPTNPEAIMKDGMQMDIPTQSMEMWYVFHDLSDNEVGAKSSL
jgi:hypothetical protein